MRWASTFSKWLLFGLSGASAACATGSREPLQEQRPTLFECVDETSTVRLLGDDDGTLTLIVGDAGHGRLEHTFDLSDETVRVGNVVGQIGGYQNHLRITVDDTHYILLHGVDGQTAIEPGRTYAAVTLVQGDFESEMLIVDCASTPLNSQLLENVDAHAKSAGTNGAKPEPANGPFDGWF